MASGIYLVGKYLDVGNFAKYLNGMFKDFSINIQGVQSLSSGSDQLSPPLVALSKSDATIETLTESLENALVEIMKRVDQDVKFNELQRSGILAGLLGQSMSDFSLKGSYLGQPAPIETCGIYKSDSQAELMLPSVAMSLALQRKQRY